MAKKLGPCQQWMADHPDDVPYPRGGAGVHWRRARGLDRWHIEKQRLRAEEKRKREGVTDMSKVEDQAAPPPGIVAIPPSKPGDDSVWVSADPGHHMLTITKAACWLFAVGGTVEDAMEAVTRAADEYEHKRRAAE